MVSHGNHIRDKIAHVQDIIDYQFKDPALLWEALQSAGSNVTTISGTPCHRPNGNRELAMVGDAVLRQVIVCDLYQRRVPRGTIQTTVARLVCNANLMAIGTTEGLGTCVEKNPSQMGEISPQTMTTAVEAIIGAVHLDDGHGEDAVRRVMQSLGLVYDIAG